MVIHECRRRAARRADPSAPDPETDAASYVACPACAGARNEKCFECGGLGSVKAPKPELTDEQGERLAPFLEAWQMVESYGPQGALCMLGAERVGWHPSFAEQCLRLDGRLAELEQLDREKDAAEARKKKRK